MSKDQGMLEQIPYLQNELLGAPPEIVIPAAIFLFAVMIRVLAMPPRARTVEQDDLVAEARGWICDRIDEHLRILAAAHGEAGARAEHDELPPGFAATVETFIAEVLLRKSD